MRDTHSKLKFDARYLHEDESTEKILEFHHKPNLKSLKDYIQNTKYLLEIYLHQVKPCKEKDCEKETRFDLVHGAYQSHEILR